MARLRDFVPAMRKVGVVPFTKKIIYEVSDDDLVAWAAAMAYSWLFAVFPFLIFLLTLVPLLPINHEQAMTQLTETIPNWVPKSAADPILAQIDDVIKNPRTGLMTFGILVTLFTASKGIAMTISALNACYDIEKPRPMYISIPFSVLMTIVLATLILAILILLPIGTTVTYWFKKQLTTTDMGYEFLRQQGVYASMALEWIWNIARWSLALLCMMTAIGILYGFGPKRKQKFHWLTPGSVFTIGVWIVLGILMRQYVNIAAQSYNQTYGAIGAAAILLLVFYLDSLVLLIGAEINSEIDNALRVPEESAAPAPEAKVESSVV